MCSGVHAKVQAYIAALDALKAEHALLQGRMAEAQAELGANGGESNVQKIQRMNEAIYALQQKMKQMMKSQAAAMAKLEEEVMHAEREAMQAKNKQAEISRLADEERAHAAERERVLLAEIDALHSHDSTVQSVALDQMSTMVDALCKVRNEKWIASGASVLPMVNIGTGEELLQVQLAAIASITQAVTTER
jgi:alanyl-tRNA synthetase